MHLRMPSIDQGVQAGAWAVFFFFLLWIGMLAVGVSNATAAPMAAPATVQTARRLTAASYGPLRLQEPPKKRCRNLQQSPGGGLAPPDLPG